MFAFGIGRAVSLLALHNTALHCTASPAAFDHSLVRLCGALQETRKRLERELEHTFNTDKPAAASGSDSESDDDGWDSTRNMSVEERQRWFLTKIKQVGAFRVVSL